MRKFEHFRKRQESLAENEVALEARITDIKTRASDTKARASTISNRKLGVDHHARNLESELKQKQFYTTELGKQVDALQLRLRKAEQAVGIQNGKENTLSEREWRLLEKNSHLDTAAQADSKGIAEIDERIDSLNTMWEASTGKFEELIRVMGAMEADKRQLGEIGREMKGFVVQLEERECAVSMQEEAITVEERDLLDRYRTLEHSLEKGREEYEAQQEAHKQSEAKEEEANRLAASIWERQRAIAQRQRVQLVEQSEKRLSL